MLSRILLSAAAAVAMTAAASAADIYPSGGGLKDGYVPFTWTGFYIGAGAGPQSAHIGFDNEKLESGAFGTVHAFASGQVGYNLQVGHFLYGVEGDVGYNDLTNTKIYNYAYGADGGAYADLTGRIGFILPRTLIYGKGGVAFTDFKGSVNQGPGAYYSKTDSLTGWTAGGGIEFLIVPKWTIKFEYLHFDYGNTTAFSDGPYKASFDPQVETFKFGFNYHVGSGYQSLK